MRVHKICDTFGRVTAEENRARDYLCHLMRGEYITALFGEDAIRALADGYDKKVGADTPLTEIYGLLSEDQKRKLRVSVENPAVRMKWNEDGEMQEAWATENLHLLVRLESGVSVGARSERQIRRKPGDKAF